MTAHKSQSIVSVRRSCIRVSGAARYPLQVGRHVCDPEAAHSIASHAHLNLPPGVTSIAGTFLFHFSLVGASVPCAAMCTSHPLGQRRAGMGWLERRMERRCKLKV